MHNRSGGATAALMVGLVVFSGVQAWGQTPSMHRRALADNVLIPQSRLAGWAQRDQVEVTGVQVAVKVVDQVATTTMTIDVANRGAQRAEAELIVPVPDRAAVRRFAYQGSVLATGASTASARVLPAIEARDTYDAIVARLRDPALLEFVGFNLIRSSVFPVEAGGVQRLRLVYEHVLTADGDRVDLVLPRSESLDHSMPWDVTVTIKSKQPISAVYSPSHVLDTVTREAKAVTVRVAQDQPGAFRLSYLVQRNGVTASLMAYPDPDIGGGYFLLFGGLPAEVPGDAKTSIKRDVTLVLDRSGSMGGEKIEQVREACLQIIAAMKPGETFNICTYSDSIEFFAAGPVVKTKQAESEARKYLEGIQAGGGTNIHAALTQALSREPSPAMLPIVLFLTDGLPTVGETSEVAIREVAMKANPHNRRIFTFGVGVDVNVPLLDKIAGETRATSTYVLPGEDVEVKVAQVFKRLTGPVLADAKLETFGGDGATRVRDMVPAELPDLYEGNQLIVLGKYIGQAPIQFKLSGNYRGESRAFTFTFGFDRATQRNGFVPRLWASRRIGVLIDAIRQLGANGGPHVADASYAPDPRVKELVDEVVRLGTKFGILTEYTSFLALEGTDLNDWDNVLAVANDNFERQAIRTRSGVAAVGQSFNTDNMQKQSVSNGSNLTDVLSVVDAFDGKAAVRRDQVSYTTIQQVSDLAFYNRGGRWVDSRIVQQEAEITPAKVIEYGSEAFHTLVRRLADQGRQGAIAFRSDVLLVVDGVNVLVKAPTGTK